MAAIGSTAPVVQGLLVVSYDRRFCVCVCVRAIFNTSWTIPSHSSSEFIKAPSLQVTIKHPRNTAAVGAAAAAVQHQRISPKGHIHTLVQTRNARIPSFQLGTPSAFQVTHIRKWNLETYRLCSYVYLVSVVVTMIRVVVTTGTNFADRQVNLGVLHVV